MVAADTKDVELCYPAMYFTAVLDLMDNFQWYPCIVKPRNGS